MKYLTEIKLNLLTDAKDDYEANKNSSKILLTLINKLPLKNFERIANISDTNMKLSTQDLEKINKRLNKLNTSA